MKLKKKQTNLLMFTQADTSVQPYLNVNIFLKKNIYTTLLHLDIYIEDILSYEIFEIKDVNYL